MSNQRRNTTQAHMRARLLVSCRAHTLAPFFNILHMPNYHRSPSLPPRPHPRPTPHVPRRNSIVLPRHRRLIRIPPPPLLPTRLLERVRPRLALLLCKRKAQLPLGLLRRGALLENPPRQPAAHGLHLRPAVRIGPAPPPRPPPSTGA
jgi:hypothetical protein